MDARGPRLSWRELALAVLAAIALALLMHWPLPLHLGSQVERDIGDPLVQAWQVAWGGHAIAHQPLHYFDANTFYPLRDSLAFSDALAGYAPAGLVGDGVTAAIARYNLLFLFSYALAFVGAYLLARELGARPAAAAVAGVAFAYAPWRLEQDGHLHVLASGGIPLALFLLVRGYRSQRAGTVLGGWIVAAWQASLGFTLGLQFGYLLGVLGVAGAVAAVVAWWRSGRRAPRRALIAASVAGVAVLAATAVTLSLPYQRVLEDHPEAERSLQQLSGLSGPVEQFAAAPEENLIWGEATAGMRERLTSVPEQTLFPGLAIVALAIAGLFSPAYPRGLRAGLGVAVVVCALLSLGFHEHGAGRFYPYRILYELAPGWQGVRVPGRINTLTSLALALLAAGGAHRLLAGVKSRRLAGAACALLVAAICVEGSGFQIAPDGGGAIAGPSHPTVPKPPSGQRGLDAPQLHLPITIPANRRYVLWSTQGFPKIVNGRGSFDPAFFERLTTRVRSFPDRESVTALRDLDVRTVVLHPGLATGTVWQGSERHSIAGLGVRVQRREGVVVYSLAP